MKLIIVTGPAGSGKTTGLRALEDAGWFSMDNLPVPLLPRLLELMAGQEAHTRLAVAIDARDVENIRSAGAMVDELRDQGADVQVVFFETREDELIRRFNETRRRHPLSGSGDLKTGLEKERDLLTGLWERADLKIDTSTLTVHDLKSLILNHFTEAEDSQLIINCMSFGFKHGPPIEADLTLDVRFLPNPHFVPGLREKSGLDAAVADFVHGADDTPQFLQHTMNLLEFLLPRYVAERKAYLTIGIGCTGGQHRSVVITEELAKRLSDHGYKVHARHRERSRWPTPSTEINP